MPALSRADNSVLGRWWWTVDRWTLGAIGTLIGFGYIMMLAASPAVAERIGTSRETFILKQVVFLALAGLIVFMVSLLSPRAIKRLAIAACLLSEGKKSPRFPGMLAAFAVFGVILLLLKSQPDIGMLAVVTVVFLAQ